MTLSNKMQSQHYRVILWNCLCSFQYVNVQSLGYQNIFSDVLILCFCKQYFILFPSPFLFHFPPAWMLVNAIICLFYQFFPPKAGTKISCVTKENREGVWEVWFLIPLQGKLSSTSSMFLIRIINSLLKSSTCNSSCIPRMERLITIEFYLGNCEKQLLPLELFGDNYNYQSAYWTLEVAIIKAHSTTRRVKVSRRLFCSLSF